LLKRAFLNGKRAFPCAIELPKLLAVQPVKTRCLSIENRRGKSRYLQTFAQEINSVYISVSQSLGLERIAGCRNAFVALDHCNGPLTSSARNTNMDSSALFLGFPDANRHIDATPKWPRKSTLHEIHICHKCGGGPLISIEIQRTSVLQLSIS
jgi:hypothetical protein